MSSVDMPSGMWDKNCRHALGRTIAGNGDIKADDKVVMTFRRQTTEDRDVEAMSISADEAHVVAFNDGTFLGQAWTRVKTVEEAVFYTQSEAIKKGRVYRLETYSIVPLRKFDLNAMCDQVNKEGVR